jgi:hypothetical protein
VKRAIVIALAALAVGLVVYTVVSAQHHRAPPPDLPSIDGGSSR